MINSAPDHLANNDLLNELRLRKGLIPVSIDPEKQTLTWADFGMYHFYEGFFRKSMNIYESLKADIMLFTTGLDILEDDRITSDFIYPSGFIFHAGHCRSTALSKSLARSRKNLVLSEATPLSQILPILNAGTELLTNKNKQIYRNLTLAMCRYRVPTHIRCFIKFTSHNIHSFDLIHSVFPTVPAIFLSRNSAEIVASFRRQLPAWFREGDDLEEKVKGFLSKAESIPQGRLLQIDHLAVTAENLQQLLSSFNIHPDETELILMKSQFGYDSKVEFNRKVYPSII